MQSVNDYYKENGTVVGFPGMEDDTAKNLNARVSKENPAVQIIYDKYLDHPLSHKAHELLHTKYFVRPKKGHDHIRDDER